MTARWVSFTLCIALMASGGVESAERLYKWVDDQGNVHYSDSIPPDEARQRRDREIKSGSGRTVDVLEAPPTREELEARRAQQAREREEEARREQARQRDRTLLMTYSSVDDIRDARDQRLRVHDARINAVRNRLESLVAQREDAASRAAALERSGGDTTAAYEKIESLDRRIEQNRRAIEEIEAKKARLRERYALDIERFRELTD